MSRSLVLSAILHATVVALVLLLTRHAATVSGPEPAVRTSVQLVWLADPGPGGGGGGGGNQMNAPPRRAELPGKDARTIPAATSARPSSEPANDAIERPRFLH
jgi:hypothetical protein